jgi:hypothetical protein
MTVQESRIAVSTHQYKGHTITLIPSREGLMWACQYVITRLDQTEVDGFAGNTYESREHAEADALARAKELVDESRLDKDLLEN